MRPVLLSADFPLSDTLNGVGTVADSLNNNGSMVTIAAIFIVLFIVLFLVIIYNYININKKLIDYKAETNKTFDNFSKDLVSKVFDDWLKNNGLVGLTAAQQPQTPKPDPKEEEEKKNLVKIFIDYHNVFKDACRNTLENLCATRIGIYVFHNGQSSPQGFPFIKISCIHQEYSRVDHSSNHFDGNVRRQLRSFNHNNLLLYQFTSIIESLYNNGEFVIGNVHEEIIKGNQDLENFVNGLSARSMFMLAIYTPDNIISGFVDVEFDHELDFCDQDIYNNVKNHITNTIFAIKYIINNEEFKEQHRMTIEDNE